LLTKNLIFNYSTEYVLKHEKIAAVKDFQLNEKEFDEFINYIKDKDYTYKTETELAFEDLKKNAEDEKYFNNMKSEYEALVAKVKSEKKDDLVKYRAEIKQFLEEEIVSRYYYQVGRLEQ